MTASLDRLTLQKVVYDELRREARLILSRHAHGHSVTPTVLVHDAYLRIAASGDSTFESELHFRAAAAMAMRHVLVDRARRRGSLKRGRGWNHVSWTGEAGEGPIDLDILALNNALEALNAIDEEGATIVQLRFFGGLTNDEVAATMGLPLRTVERSWRASRAWLFDKLGAT